jgi:hypothetical protein
VRVPADPQKKRVTNDWYIQTHHPFIQTSKQSEQERSMKNNLIQILLIQLIRISHGFVETSKSSILQQNRALRQSSFLSNVNHDLSSHTFMLMKNQEEEIIDKFDPLSLSSAEHWSSPVSAMALTSSLMGTATAFSLLPYSASAKFLEIANTEEAFKFSTGDFNPNNFRPVCPASDGIYRFAQSTTQNIVGKDNFVEYGPLIAGGLLRVRLELCVVESFFNEAVGPFIEREGLRWVLPLHETVETFLAGTIFALASTFILVGSTKIVSVLATYADVFVGLPARSLGGFAFDRARGKPVTFDIGFGPFKTRIVGPGSPQDDKNKPEETLADLMKFEGIEGKDLVIVVLAGGVKAFGETSKVVKEVLEALDLFVGRYLTLIATGYIGIKFIHFKIFPDFPPF